MRFLKIGLTAVLTLSAGAALAADAMTQKANKKTNAVQPIPEMSANFSSMF